MTPFRDLTDYVALPAVTALRLAPDGSWLAATVQSLAPDGKEFTASLWRIDPAGAAAPARLTISAERESSPEFLPDGGLLFISKRTDPTAAKPAGNAEPEQAGLWLLPAGGGEARRVVAPAGGVCGVAAARAARALVFTARVLPGAASGDEDAKRRQAREDAGVSAILHEAGMVRYWDHDLGPDALRLHAAELAAGTGSAATEGAGAAGAGAGAAGGGSPEQEAAVVRDLTPEPGRALDEQSFELSPDASVVVSGWSVLEPAGEIRREVVAIDTATGGRRTLLAEAGADFQSPRISPDGRLVVAIRAGHDRYDRPGDVTLVTAPLAAPEPGPGQDLLAGFDRRPVEMAWAPDSRAVYFTADDQGRRPVFRARLGAAAPDRVTADDAAYTDLCPGPDGKSLYALRSAVTEPPTPVRIDLGAQRPAPVRLPCPGGPLPVPGRAEEVSAVAGDGTTIRGWLVLPESASPRHRAPLLLWVHGGPQMSWNAWSWRWNPWLMAARGYAVLLPDPALSTGYGQHMIERGWGDWGGAPYTDVLAITDAVLTRPDIDPARTAMMGGSFGGYMANWIAGHTGRFAAIVSHAGLWALDQMFATTDVPSFWRRVFGDPAGRPERYQASSPHRHVDKITTPMLIIHGDKDYRVPVGEALRMWWDLTGRGKTVKFLYYPEENHWILRPGDVRVWYETVLAFLAEHVLGEDWQRPGLL